MVCLAARIPRLACSILFAAIAVSGVSSHSNKRRPLENDRTPQEKRVWSNDEMKQYAFRRDVVHRAEARTKELQQQRRNRLGQIQRSQSSIDDILMEKAIPLADYEARLNAAGFRSSRVNEEPQFMNIPSYNRRLEDGDDDGDDYYMNDDAMYEFDGYSLKYATCQPIQRYSGAAVENGEYSALVTDDIVVLRLCPRRQCSSDSKYGCNAGYGEYAMGLSDYLRIMIRYELDKQKNLCNFCLGCDGGNANRHRALEDAEGEGEEGEEQEKEGEENKEQDDFYAYNGGQDDYEGGGNGDDGNGDDGYDACNEYQDLCEDYGDWCDFSDDDQDQDQGDGDDDGQQALDYSGYINYFGCIEIEDQGGDDPYYVNPRCDAYTGTISMGIFYDPYCSQYAGNDVSLNDVSGVKFQNDIFEDFYAGECIECSKSNDPPYYNANGNMCNRIHDLSGKCLTYFSYDLDGNGNYDENAEVVCSFIESIRLGTYDASGQIYIDSSQDSSNQQGQVTTPQLIGLGVLSLICAGLALYACYLHHSITNLLLKSLSHSQLLGDHRRRSRSRSKDKRSRGSSGGRGSSNGGKSKGSSRGRRQKDDDWDYEGGGTYT